MLGDTIIAQEFILDSYEMLIKIYAIGTTFDVVFKPTLPKDALLRRLNKDGYVQIGQKTKFEDGNFNLKKQ